MRNLIRTSVAPAAGAAIALVLVGATAVHTDEDIVSEGNVWAAGYVIGLTGVSSLGTVKALEEIESTVGGFKFPDGTTQKTALVGKTSDPACPDDSGNIYVDCGNGTVTDNRTGLVWLKNASCTGGTVKWHWAMEVAAGLSDLPGDDPDDCGGGCWASGPSSFSDVRIAYNSSTSVLSGDGSLAWNMDLGDGVPYTYPKTANIYFWPVRDG